ncbi:YcjF family protein [Synoicihabitans lomoniglobus]|uniref:DUF697 domain-containing protein n=1 Tax=Synoicihabitans lomoniglobus TaxID=2909285 RepID=A0AAE9ZYI7_9BACT|nr:DUF697 domain-containing protein [Opitutaceae bacterium LMO-M01]WED65724.1 DUF697 domain-containing protein [Opitutaceae bacterium LMO-M01]
MSAVVAIASPAHAARQRRWEALEQQRRGKAMDIVHAHVLGSVGANLIPIPVVNSAAIAGLQVTMLRELARYYGKPFDASSARVLVSSLTIGVVDFAVTHTAIAMQFKTLVASIPVVGGLLRHGAWPGVLAGYTYVLGRSCVEHYEAGGDFTKFSQTTWARMPLNPMVGL